MTKKRSRASDSRWPEALHRNHGYIDAAQSVIESDHHPLQVIPDVGMPMKPNREDNFQAQAEG
jgi:hypothetical protein